MKQTDIHSSYASCISNKMAAPDIVLASASPRRKELMAQAGYHFTVIPARGEEKITGTRPALVVEELSLQKAADVADRIINGETGGGIHGTADTVIVIGADTVVAADHRILGKPGDKDDARRMISEIQGNVHQVYTGVTVIRLRRTDTGYRKTDVRTFHERTDVHVFPMTGDEIESYICTSEPYDKAGAYGIQGTFGRYIEGIRGDYNNVVGLPIARLYHVLRQMI